MDFDSVNSVLDFAIGKEEEAANFYNDLAIKMERKGMKEVFEGFAREEMGHMAKLMAVKEGNRLQPAHSKVMDLKIGETVSDVQPSADLTYQQALIIAMKAEKAAFKLYNDLAGTTDDPALKDLFLSLAQEEAKHKLRFEIEYDDEILTEN